MARRFQIPDHNGNHCHQNYAFTHLRQDLGILAEASITSQPTDLRSTTPRFGRRSNPVTPSPLLMISNQGRRDGPLTRLHDALRPRVREVADHHADASAARLDRRSVQTPEVGGIKGFDAGQQGQGRERHLLVETWGLVIAVGVLRRGFRTTTGRTRSAPRSKDGVPGCRWWGRGDLREAPLEEGGPDQGDRILSQVLNRAFSRYSPLAAHFNRLVSIPRRQLVSRFRSPRANRRITLRFAGA